MTPWTPPTLVRLELLRLRTPCGLCLACADAKPEKCLKLVPPAPVPR